MYVKTNSHIHVRLMLIPLNSPINRHYHALCVFFFPFTNIEEMLRIVKRFQSSTTVGPTVYGHYVSQPARATLWLLKLKNEPFVFKKLEPTASKNWDTTEPEFVKNFPGKTVPALSENGVNISEVGAIMQYLCESRGWNDWYPSTNDQVNRTKVNMMLHWHHQSTRYITLRVFRPFLIAGIKRAPVDIVKVLEGVKLIETPLAKLEKFIEIGGTGYVAGTVTPSIADLVLFCEVAQCETLGVKLKLGPHTRKWVESMKSLPHHNDVHTSLTKLKEMLDKSGCTKDVEKLNNSL